MEGHSPEAIGSIILVLLIIFGILMSLTVGVLKVVACCKIFSKAGYGWALGLLMIIPIVNLIMLFVLGFSQWPMQRELELLKQHQKIDL